MVRADSRPVVLDGTNAALADRLREYASLLDAQGADKFRVSAYRSAADAVVSLDRSVAELAAEGGTGALEALPHIGPRIARVLHELCTTGRWIALERLRGEVSPRELFRSVAGVGPELSLRIYEALHVDTLEALEVAAHDGRLESVPGVGPRRAATIRASLAQMLGRVRGARVPSPRLEPEVSMLLEVDREYRASAAADRLPRIAPRRFNEKGDRWLPILHTSRGAWHFTALFSNTARAHELGKTHDWVVIYFDDGVHGEGQRTVVTEHRGPRKGQRVVRGREGELDEGARDEARV